MNIIGIDLATATGITHLNGDKAYISSINADRKRYGMQFAAFDAMMTTTLRTYKTLETIVFFEDIKRHSSTAAAHMYGYYRGALQRICHVQGLECVGIPVGTVKRIVAEKGNANKLEVAAGCAARIAEQGVSLYYGIEQRSNQTTIESLTHDESDSLAVALTGKFMLEYGEQIKDSADPSRKVITPVGRC